MTLKDFEKKWFINIKDGLLMNFPADFIDEKECDEIKMPGRSLIIGPELFGSYELLDIDGQSHFQTDSLHRAKYILYANRLKPVKILIPKSNDSIQKSVRSYEKHLDSILKEMQVDYNAIFKDPDKFLSVSKNVFNSLMLRRF